MLDNELAIWKEKINNYNNTNKMITLQEYLELSDDEYLELMYELNKNKYNSSIGNFGEEKHNRSYSNINYTMKKNPFRKVIQL